MLKVAAVLLLLCPLSAMAAEAVLVFSSSEAGNLAIVEGFKGSFAGEPGIIDLNGSDVNQKAVGQSLQASPPDVVIAVGNMAAQMARSYLSNVPVVYCGSVNAGVAGGSQNAISVYHETSPLDQLDAIKDLFPDRTGVTLLYSADHSEVEISSLQKKAGKLGLTLAAIEVNNIKEVPIKVREVLPTSQLLWVLTDPVVFTEYSMQYIVIQSLAAKVPVFGGDMSLARGGATAAWVPDLEDTGRKAAADARKILSGAAPDPTGVSYPEGKLIINVRIAKLLGITVTPEVESTAAEIIQ